MPQKPIFYDADVLICFLEINECEILKKLFSKVIIPEQAYDELNKGKTPQNIKNNLKNLILENFVEIKENNFSSKEFVKYECISKGYWSKNGERIGKGESAAIAFAIENNGIVASNNLSDIIEICSEFNIPIITSSMILSFAFELKILPKEKITFIWKKIIKNTYQIMPKETFEEYYGELFKKDCKELLKDYNFKKHYRTK